ncbi:hypothetical protein [Jeotgalibacillus aurantiacus]|uniref:hypothetical protein n=1 Tax=Jeotgalibacillus aurantiacus TaxID=2763266 RepID=UPI001D0B2F34|nr:hypothetical protein [Jeotgalibacillus aurantiacus]
MITKKEVKKKINSLESDLRKVDLSKKKVKDYLDYQITDIEESLKTAYPYFSLLKEKGVVFSTSDKKFYTQTGPIIAFSNFEDEFWVYSLDDKIISNESNNRTNEYSSVELENLLNKFGYEHIMKSIKFSFNQLSNEIDQLTHEASEKEKAILNSDFI